ncbi:MAG TPA: efflux RND transporter periplasmic adaptor subunit [Enhygromyxa sp.]|nr:efflux RND transporter periplasmic adaptor subunit [Enhygromyxa sp.]
MACALALASCAKAEPPPAGGEPPPAPVEIATANAGELIDEWVFVGEVRSLRSAQLALGAGGEIVLLEVREGDRVEVGELLVEIDKRQASARLSAAVSSRHESDRELEQARREAERAAKLGDVISSQEIEQQTVRAEGLEARKRRLAAEIRAAKAQLSDYQLVAPFTGIVAARYADLGQWLNPGETVLELVATDEVEILVDVRPELAPHVGVGSSVRLRPAGGLRPGLRGSEVQAEIVGVVPSLDPATRTLKIRIRPSEARSWLIPGAPVDVAFDVRFDSRAIERSVIVPRDALVLGAVDTRVIVVVDGHAKPILVDVHATADDHALVSGVGLEPGAVVVTRGNERLRPGQAVRVLEQPAGKEGSAT